jgi:hypothetical protein
MQQNKSKYRLKICRAISALTLLCVFSYASGLPPGFSETDLNVKVFFRAADDLNAKIAIPFHFGVISLSNKPLLYPLYEINQYLETNPEYAKRVRPLRVSEYILIEKPGF